MPDKAQARARIAELVEKFRTDYDTYKRQDYSEANVRNEFINEFFKALGWNVNDSQEVTMEPPLVVKEDQERKVKRPDYGFKVGRDIRFYVEAKKPSVNIMEARDPAYQVRRYGWSAHLPISILTDFEECMVYDCRFEPKYGDPAPTATLRIYRYDDYLNKWDEIWDLLSKDAVQGGALERLTEGDVRGAMLVDEAFLRDMEAWRTLLAKDIHLFNDHLNSRQLNITVQSTLDRLIFLRICEDRQIEPLSRLKRIAQNADSQKADIYEELKLLFRQADTKYNSGLFHFRDEKDQKGTPDTLSLTLKIGNDALSVIIKKLYYPISPYQFDVMPADILGQVYERFLGKVIELQGGGALEIVEKPEVRKAGGVYYTPTYIVDYIVRNTVGKLVAGKTPDEVANLKILDPACGSGSFLIVAYQFLIDWYTVYYSQKADKYQKSGDLRKLGQEHVLTTRAKKTILLNNIFGVDLDQQAVEVTKLSLLLKMLEGETATTSMPKLAIERILPDLDSNIKWGNSLIGSDFYDHQQLGLLGDEELYRVKAFDWANEVNGFGGIMRLGGFDAVIGNPPYISVTMTSKELTNYYLTNYPYSKGRTNAFDLFIQKAMKLAKLEGFWGFIVPNRILTNTQLQLLRRKILNDNSIESILSFKKPVFKASVDTVVIVSKNQKMYPDHKIEVWDDINNIASVELKKFIFQLKFIEASEQVINLKLTENDSIEKIIKKIKNLSDKLETICSIKDGIILGSVKDRFLTTNGNLPTSKMWLEGNEVTRYNIEWSGRYINYDPSIIDYEIEIKKKFADENAQNSKDFSKMSRSGIWLRNSQIFDVEKILTRQNAKRIIGVYDNSNYYVKNSLHCIIKNKNDYNLKYILGILNSKLMDFYFQREIGSTGEIFSQMKIAYIRTLPIRTIDFTNPADKKYHDSLVALVERMLDLHQQLSQLKGDGIRHDIIKGQIDATDKQIDKAVYELYGLNDEEIKMVESGL
jgi:type I restriction-modification system DNA methylase subunit